jgi:hypothetical protein
MKLKTQNFYIFMALVTLNFLNSCSSPPKDEASAPRTRPSKTDGADGGPSGDTAGAPTATPCWEKITKAPAVLACTGIYSFTTKICAGLPLVKEENCTRDTVAKSLTGKVLGGKPAVNAVDEWLGDGYEINQCAKGAKSELYVYFIKKTFVPSSATPETGTSTTGTSTTGTSTTGTSTTGTSTTSKAAPSPSGDQGSYSIADKKLGDAGDALNSIQLSKTGVLEAFTCE